MQGIETLGGYKSTVFLVLGSLALAFTVAVPPLFAGLPVPAWQAIGVVLLMAIWWTGEAAPIPVTSLVPLVVVPVLGLATIADVASAYAHPLIFLFMGGFMLSLAMEKCNLHRRIALLTLSFFGSKPSMQVAGVMLVTAFLSMWMSNTATAVMMLPIGLSIIELGKAQGAKKSQFPNALLLGIAYSASIGGVATLIGTPPNALLAAYLSDSFNIHIGFSQWMLLGFPLSVLMLFFVWLWLTRGAYRLPRQGFAGADQLIHDELKQLKSMSRAEKSVAVIFVATAALWMFRPVVERYTGLPISDSGIAILAAVLLFIIPSGEKGDYLLNWENTQKLPWGVLILFGGGLALAGLVGDTGLGEYIANAISLQSSLQPLLLVLLVTGVVVFLTEITSNTATAAGFLPLLGPISLSITDNPLFLTVPAALAASCAFMLPVATPPNSVVFASGEIKVHEMIRAGFVLNVFCCLCITVACYFLLGVLSFG